MASKTPDKVTQLFSDLMFEKRLSLVSEGFCPYCEVALGEQVRFGPFVRSRCSCCGALYRTCSYQSTGFGWTSRQGHDCPHTGAWTSDENASRVRFEFRDRRVLGRAGRASVIWR